MAIMKFRIAQFEAVVGHWSCLMHKIPTFTQWLYANMFFASSVLNAQSSQLPCEQHFHVTEQAVQVFRINVVNYFIFLSGEVNGTSGKFMLDTGTRDSVVLNDHLLSLGGGEQKGQGQVGSGQSYSRVLHPCVNRIGLRGAPEQQRLANIESNNLDFIENDITPDFLGFLGYDAFAGYSFKLDYARLTLTFYKADKGERLPSLEGETVLATLPFTTRKRPNDPFISVTLGGVPFVAAFDTGQSGTLEMSQQTRNSLIARKILIPLPGKDEDGNAVYRIEQLKLPNGLTVSLPALPISEPGSIADKGIGITEDKAIFLGYLFLNQFKSVWDFPNHTLYLLQK